MQDVVSTGPTAGQGGGRRVLPRLLAYLPRGNTLDDRAWHRRHRLLERVLLLHVPLVVGLGLMLGHSAVQATEAVVAPLICLVLGHLVTYRRWASFFVTGGLVFCSIALVLLTGGTIEAHFHFFIIIGFIALYQDWVPFLWNVAIHHDQPRHRHDLAGRADLQPPRGASAPVAVVVRARRRRAVRVYRHGDLLAGHRGRADQEGGAGPTADHRGCGDRAPEVHLRDAGEPRAAQPEHALPPARHHQRAGEQGAGPGRTGGPVQARPSRHPRAAQRREPAGARGPAGSADLVRAGAAARRHPSGDRRDRGPRPCGVRRRRPHRGLRHRHRGPDPSARRTHRERRPVLSARDRGDDPRATQPA